MTELERLKARVTQMYADIRELQRQILPLAIAEAEARGEGRHFILDQYQRPESWPSFLQRLGIEEPLPY